MKKKTFDIILGNIHWNSLKFPPTIMNVAAMRELLQIYTTKSPFRGVDGERSPW